MCTGSCDGPLERLTLSAGELRAVADEVGPTSVVLADLSPDLSHIVKERRRQHAAALRTARALGQ